MKTITSTTGMLFLLITTLFSQVFQGTVVNVKDGDSMEILINDQVTEVRLSGIDCPEYNQDYGDKATQFTISKCKGRTVIVTKSGIDKYKRTLAKITLPDGTDLSELLVKNGYAWHYKQYSTDSTLTALEFEAIKNKSGLWSEQNPVAPWDYRRGTYSNTMAGVNNDTNYVSITTNTDNTEYVLICNSKSSYAYHSYQCRGLQRCTHDIIKITRQEAINRGRNACKICYR